GDFYCQGAYPVRGGNCCSLQHTINPFMPRARISFCFRCGIWIIKLNSLARFCPPW
ncbi:GL25734, partial [Drosophila persimilis]